MADLKISALPASATPLAGTEVLPIVQSSATKQVSVDNVTAGRNVAVRTLAANTTLSAWVAPFDSLVELKDGVSMSSAYGIGYNPVNAYVGSGGFTYRNSSVASLYQNGPGTHEWSRAASGTAGAAVTWISQLKTDSSDNVIASTGNVVIGTAAKGIDFSANTGTAGMTSELLNWYEEGTYIATLTPQTSGSITVNSANNWNTLAYTRIGRVVYVQGGIRVSAVSSPSGSVVLNLPFTAANLTGDAGISVGIAVAESLGVYNQPFAMYVAEGTATAFIQYMNLGSRTSVPGSDFSGNEEMQFNITYIAA